MTATSNPLKLYRAFQIVACALGPVLVLIGYALGLGSQLGAGVAGAGAALFIHGLLAALLLPIEARAIRAVSPSALKPETDLIEVN